MLTYVLMGLANAALVAVNGVAIFAVVARLWKKRDAHPLEWLVGRALAAAWLLSVVALVIDIGILVQEAVVHVAPADKATIVSAGLTEALNCLALYLIVTLLPIAAYLFLRVSAARATSATGGAQ